MCLCRFLLHLTEEIHHAGKDNQQDATARTKPKHLWDEAFVESGEAFLLVDRHDSWPGPVVLGHIARDLGSVLD